MVDWSHSPEDYRALEEQVDTLQADDGQDTRTINRLHRELEDARRTDRIATMAQAAVQALTDSGEIYIDAEQEARDDVIGQLRAEVTEEQKRQLLTENSDVYRAEFGTNELDALRRELDELYAGDGTYRDLRNQVEAGVRVEVSQDLIDAKAKEIDGLMRTPEVHAGMVAAERQRLTDEGVFGDMIKARKAELQPTWRAEAIAAASSELDVTIAAEKAGYQANITRRWLNSPKGRAYRLEKRDELQKEWADKSAHDVAVKVGNEELQQLLAERAERETVEERRQKEYARHLAQFSKGGIDIDAIEAGTAVAIQFGEVEATSSFNKDWDNQFKTAGKRELRCDREISLTALGDGRFVVDQDTLSLYDMPYVQNDAIAPDTVVRLGRRLVEDGKPVLYPRLKRDASVLIEDDTSDADTKHIDQPVINVVIDGMSARQDIDSVRHMFDRD